MITIVFANHSTMMVDTYIELFERPIDSLRVYTHAVVLRLRGDGSLVETGDGAFGELWVYCIGS